MEIAAFSDIHHEKCERSSEEECQGTIHNGRPHRGGVGPKADIVKEVAWI